MKPLFASAALLALMSGTALAADASVVGDWLVKDGYGHVRIDNCGGKMWGIVSWEREPGLDKENPDPAKKGRPLLGTPVLMGLAPVKNEPGKWTGEIYNSQNGKLYGATISLANENTLDLEGCLMWPLCQTQQWTRVNNPPPNATPLPPIKSAPASQTKGPPAAKAGPKGAAQAAQSDVCLRVAAEQASSMHNGATAKK
jgi:uncharacterized protein (DUF2147 family)